MNQVDRDPKVCGPIITGSRTKEQSETHYQKVRRTKTMVQVSRNLMSNPAIAEALQKPKYPVHCVKCGWTGYRTHGPLGFCKSGPLRGCSGVLVWTFTGRTKPKSKYPLCYCKVCQGDTQRAECPNKHNPTQPADSIWFRALRGEPIPAIPRRKPYRFMFACKIVESYGFQRGGKKRR